MAVGKPDFDLNSFGVKYLSKDQVQNFLEIKKRKDQGDVGKDPDTPGLEGKEVSTNEITGIKTVRPKPVKRGGFKGRSMRRVDPKTGDQIKVGQTDEETTPPEGQVPTSRLNDVQFGKLGEESASEVGESFDMITNSPKWKEEIHRDAPLTTEQGTEKFDDTPANRALRDRIAAREHKKKLAAEKKKKLKKANDIIMDMNIMKLDLMKDALDPKAKPQEDLLGNPNTALPKNTRVGQKPPKVHDAGDYEEDYGTGEQFGNPYHGSTTRITAQGIKNQNKPRYQSTDPGAKYYKNPKVGGSKTDPHKPKSADRKNTYKSADETIFKAISLKLDLMKDGIEGGGKNIPSGKKVPWIDNYGQQHKEGQAETARNQYDKVGLIYGDAKGKRPVKGVNKKPDSRIDPEDYTYDEKTEVGSTGDASSYPADPAEKRYPAAASGTHADYMQHWDKRMGEHRQRGTEHNTHQEPSKLDSKDRGTTLPKGLKEKAEETIYKATSLKLDLMKGKKGTGKISYATPDFDQSDEDIAREKDVYDEFLANWNPNKGFLEDNKKPSPKSALGKSADETIFKAISLKLDLMKDGSPVPSAPYGTTIQRLRDGEGSGTRRQAARASTEDAYKKDHPEEDEDDFDYNTTPLDPSN